jgi:hypothetical protein
LGDLNYRLTADDLEEVYNKIDECDMEWLLDHDQVIFFSFFVSAEDDQNKNDTFSNMFHPKF